MAKELLDDACENYQNPMESTILNNHECTSSSNLKNSSLKVELLQKLETVTMYFIKICWSRMSRALSKLPAELNLAETVLVSHPTVSPTSPKKILDRGALNVPEPYWGDGVR
ncbi:uncharacterized protein LOC129745288 [Uranotaenia lowii]|uniref:uncharacterized protein LOC129745288 n=1 Tax=Uranotaenia lowii TaxID=190385 RepID=UPI002478DF35|nr:uncharacterized protein LOC129745288 [Uranotaenia lowii]